MSGQDPPAASRPRIGRQLVVLELVVAAAGLLGILVAERVVPGASRVIAVTVATLLAVSATGGLVEALAAIRAREPSWPPDQPFPKVTGIIAAYLPNEAEIVVDTIAEHLRAGPPNMQVVLAYNTPASMPIEAELARLAASEPRLTVLPVPHSRSKAENVNAALQVATGAIIGVFDADHHPAAGSYERAWCWLVAGADVVQGRCTVRRGTDRGRTLLEAVVTAEFEQMYAVSHPGRTRVHGFGLFGGSNGYWRADALNLILLDSSALTEDIDASVRLLRAGGRIVTDPAIVSNELPPPSLGALCHQRLRWSQGWFQVARRHLAATAADRRVPVRVRLGAVWLFGLGPALPWVSALTIPLVSHHAVTGDLGQNAPTVAVLAAASAASAVTQAVVGFRHATPSTRRAGLFAGYVVVSAVAFTPLRNAIARLAHLRELTGHREWRVTPRSAPLMTTKGEK